LTSVKITTADGVSNASIGEVSAFRIELRNEDAPLPPLPQKLALTEALRRAAAIGVTHYDKIPAKTLQTLLDNSIKKIKGM
jgi:hypothetical protein